MSGKMYHKIFILFGTYYIAYVLTASFSWLKDDVSYDYIVGISVHDQPICTGAIVTMYTVITSANPLDKYLKSEGKMRIHTVGYKHDHSISQRVYAIYGDQAYRKKQWVQIGYNQTHTTVHDLVLIRLRRPIYASKNSRGPRYANLPFRNSIFNAPLQATGWAVAGFGYVDKKHVKNNSRLEVTTLSGNLVDCDEWMPREWGHFICVTDDDDLRRIPSGGPLILDKKAPIIYGIASFSLKKGNETILVFTNLKKYRNGLTGYTPNSTKL